MVEPSELTDEELNKVIETGVEPDEPETPEPKEAEPTAQEEETPIEPEIQDSPEPIEEEQPKEVPEEKPPSRREQLRIQTLLQKYPRLRDKGQQQAPSQQETLDYSKELDADPEVINRLEEDRRVATESAFYDGNERAMKNLQFTQFYNDIRFDLPLVSEKMSKLEPEVAKAIDQKYLQITGANPATGTVDNPNISYLEFVEAEIEFGQRLAESMSRNTANNIAKQAATTGLRPDGSSAKRLNLNQAPENMTDEELYAAIGQKPPKK